MGFGLGGSHEIKILKSNFILVVKRKYFKDVAHWIASHPLTNQKNAFVIVKNFNVYLICLLKLVRRLNVLKMTNRSVFVSCIYIMHWLSVNIICLFNKDNLIMLSSSKTSIAFDFPLPGLHRFFDFLVIINVMLLFFLQPRCESWFPWVK